MIFLFDESFTIYGGNIASTMAGEFSFSIALSLAFVYFGVLARGLRTGTAPRARGRAVRAGVLCHLIVAIFAVAGTVVWFLLYARPAPLQVARRRSVPVGALLTAFWIVPFFLRRHYLTDMGYERRTDYVNMLFPFTWKWDAALFALGALGLARLDREAAPPRRLARAHGARSTARGSIVWPQSMLWNARLLPFQYLCRYLLAAIGVAEIGLWLASTCARRRVTPDGPSAFVTALDAGRRRGDLRRDPRHEPARSCPRRPHRPEADLLGQRRRVQLARRSTSTQAAFVDDWAKWNYAGYEGKAAYGEYHGVVHDDGRARQDSTAAGGPMWENDDELEPVRHADGADAAAVLDRRLHRLDGGPVLRVVGHHAVPLPRQLGAVRGTVTPGAQPALRRPSTSTKGVQYLQLLGVQVLHGVLPDGREARRASRTRPHARSRPPGRG